eukprot:8419235-Pyramimonas_sp.AAC.1
MSGTPLQSVPTSWFAQARVDPTTLSFWTRYWAYSANSGGKTARASGDHIWALDILSFLPWASMRARHASKPRNTAAA